MPIVTQHPLTLSYFVRDIAQAVVTFNRMRWYRSRSGEVGPYYATTAAAAAPAVLTGTTTSPHAVVGKTFSFLVNGVNRVDVTFTGSDPLSTSQVVAQIAAATGLVVASADASTRLVLTTTITGTAASIKVLESDASAILGLQTDDGAVGIDQDLVLVNGTHEYFYTDQNSDESFFYKTQLVNSVTGAVSDFSVPIPADQVQALPVAQTVVCSIQLVDMRGRPLRNRRVTFFNAFVPDRVLGTGVFRHYDQIETDRNGYAEIRLLRGITLDMSVDGTGFVRRITIPSLGDSVDLLDPALVSSDEFGIQQQDIDFAIRMS